MTQTARFLLPPRGSLEPNDARHDPLAYYYVPLLGRLFRRRIELLFSLFEPPFRHVIDFGYGSGLLFPSLAPMAQRVTGVDIRNPPPGILDRLRALGVDPLPKLFRGPLNDTVCGRGEADLILAASVFEHIAEPQPVLEAMHRALCPGGALIVGMPRVDAVMERLFDLIGWRHSREEHVTTPAEFRRRAAPLFRLEAEKTLSPAGFPLYYAMRLRRREPA